MRPKPKIPTVVTSPLYHSKENPKPFRGRLRIIAGREV